jgi:rhamnulokinase
LLRHAGLGEGAEEWMQRWTNSGPVEDGINVMRNYYVACDFGAESGRMMVGELYRGKLAMSELHRFANTPTREKDSLYWDIPQLFQELMVGVQKISTRGDPIAGISCDSWGVDYLLFGEDGSLLTPTFHYRDRRGEAGMKLFLDQVPWETIYGMTGIQKMPLNTLFQLAAENPKRLRQAHFLLPVADGFNYLLSNVAKCEVSMASTTQLYNPVQRAWSQPLIAALRLPSQLLPPVVPSGTVLGPLRSDLAQQPGFEETKVIASCSHDTGAAVAALPTSGENWAFLSSGTWSLMGVEVREPLINETSRELNFTNEIGHGHSVRLLKNIVGLWIVQECRRHWAEREQELDYEVMTHLAGAVTPFQSLINPADPRFLTSGDMPQKVAAFCKETNQPVPRKPGEVIRCVLESLALYYRKTLREIERVTGRKIEKLYVVGGGTKNTLLNHFTANALQIPLIIGPSEATSVGNILVQAIALGHLKSLEEARRVVQESFSCEIIQPHAAAWDAAYARMVQFL